MLKWLKEKIETLVEDIQEAYLSAIRPKLTCERGDTNFISILIILGIVIILAGVFMAFKDQIVGQVQEIIEGFTIH